MIKQVKLISKLHNKIQLYIHKYLNIHEKFYLLERTSNGFLKNKQYSNIWEDRFLEKN